MNKTILAPQERDANVMKTKEKVSKRKKIGIKVTLKNTITFLALLLSILYVIIFYNYFFGRNKVYATQVNAKMEDTKISKAAPIKVEEIMMKNEEENKKEEYIVEETTLEYITKYNQNASLPKGKIQVIQEGREGKQEITIKKTYLNEALISEEQVSNKVTKAAVNKIVEIGTGSEKSTYRIKVGDTLQVTSDRLPVMVEPNENSQKVTTLTKGDSLKLLGIENEWYKISCASTTGFVKAENTISMDFITKQEDKTTTQNQGNKKVNFSFDMPLNQPSGLSLEQFKKILTDPKDTYKIFEENAQYFYYIEQQYKINGVFVAAVGIHESAWGTSKIAQEKKNLFGYGAYDSNPYNGAYHFSSYSESIDLLARVFVKYYINPKGKSIYGGEKATGTYYNGANLSGINTKYATDKNWANGVYQQMKYLSNKL